MKITTDAAQIQTVNSDMSGTKTSDSTIYFLTSTITQGGKVFQRFFQNHPNKFNISGRDDSFDTETEQTQREEAWLLVRTKSLEVLYCSLVALQWRVGLGGLVQQHLQSCSVKKKKSVRLA